MRPHNSKALDIDTGPGQGGEAAVRSVPSPVLCTVRLSLFPGRGPPRTGSSFRRGFKSNSPAGAGLRLRDEGTQMQVGHDTTRDATTRYYATGRKMKSS